MREPPGLWQEAVGRVLGVEPRLEGVAADGEVLLRLGQPLARGHAELPFHEVHAGDRLGDGMLDLEPRVHLHEVEPVGPQAVGGVHDELDRPRPGIADGLRRPHRRLPHGVAHLRGHAGSGGLLDDLLVAPLERAVALEEVHGAGAVAEDLHLDMARRGDPFLEQDPIVAEGLARFRHRRVEPLGEVPGPLDLAHPLAAPARDRLDKDWVADRVGFAREALRRLVRAAIARHDRHARLLHQRLGRVLEPHGPDRVGRRPDEHEPRRLHRLHEVGVLAEEPVARMDRFRARGLRRRDDGVAPQVAVGRRRPAERHRLVRHRHVAGGGVHVGMDGHRAHAEPAARVDHPAGDLAAVGDEDLSEHLRNPLDSSV